MSQRVSYSEKRQESGDRGDPYRHLGDFVRPPRPPEENESTKTPLFSGFPTRRSSIRFPSSCEVQIQRRNVHGPKRDGTQEIPKMIKTASSAMRCSNFSRSISKKAHLQARAPGQAEKSWDKYTSLAAYAQRLLCKETKPVHLFSWPILCQPRLLICATGSAHAAGEFNTRLTFA